MPVAGLAAPIEGLCVSVPLMKRSVGTAVLGLSAGGFPLTQFVIRRWGRLGAALVEAVCVGLACRDASMIAAGLPKRLRPIPATLLHLELAAGVVASAAGVGLLLTSASGEQTTAPDGGAAGTVRRSAVATLFALHTVRFGIYLRPGQGRRSATST